MGWPAIEFRTGLTRWRCQLWPLTWWQLESVLANPAREPGPRSPRSGSAVRLDLSYLELRQLADRPSIADADAGGRAAIVRGLRPAEAAGLADRLGDDWRLPTDAEWLTVYRLLTELRPVVQLSEVIEWCRAESPGPYVREICTQLLTRWKGTVPLGDLMMLGDGAVEWVTVSGAGFAGRGSSGGTDATFVAHPLDPQPVRPLGDLSTDDRLGDFGCRYVRITSDTPDRDRT
ncbi:MAG TPA: hypothetical protein VGG23_02085 [Acidimicrobiales bacterium]